MRFRYFCVLVVFTKHIVNSSACLNSCSVAVTLGCVLLLLFTLSVFHVSMCSELFPMLHACRPVCRLCRHYQACPSASYGGMPRIRICFLSQLSAGPSLFSTLRYVEMLLLSIHSNQILSLVSSHAFALIFYSHNCHSYYEN